MAATCSGVGSMAPPLAYEEGYNPPGYLYALTPNFFSDGNAVSS